MRTLWVCLLLQAALSARAPIIVDHHCTDLALIPPAWIVQAQESLRVSYGHTSHGSQLVTGITALSDDLGFPFAFTYSSGEYRSGIFLNDYFPDGDLGSPDRAAWAERTREMLERSGGCDRNVVIWSWCGQADTADPADIDTYLSLMGGLEEDFPEVRFVYMTGHLVGSGSDGDLNRRNQQIRAYCRLHDKILFDFADIESYDPDGLVDYMALNADDGCNYDGGNWAADWLSAHPESDLARQAGRVCGECCAHSQPLNCVLKGRAFWWLMARLAGWDGGSAPELQLTSPNGGETWLSGSVHAVTWTAAGVAGTVKLSLYDGSTPTGEIAGGLAAAAGRFNWRVGRLAGGTAAPGSRYRIRIRSTDGTAGDWSDARFSILAPSTLRVTSPDGGEIWGLGSTRSIAWSAQNPDGTALIDLYRNGSFYSRLGRAPLAGGTFAWTIPASFPAGNDFRVRVSGDGTADESDGPFTLAPQLTVAAGAGGTTDPAPGTYPVVSGSPVQVTAIPHAGHLFVGWSGDSSGTGNPLTVTVVRNLTVTAGFRPILAPLGAAGQKVENRSLAQRETIALLGWQANPGNAGLAIGSYRVYQRAPAGRTLLGEVGGGSELAFIHRRAGAGPLAYEIAAVTAEGREGLPAALTIE